jgi:hypothetical protein
MQSSFFETGSLEQMESDTVDTGIELRIAVAVGVTVETENEVVANAIGVIVPLKEDLTKMPRGCSQCAEGEGSPEVDIVCRDREYSDELG